jgi:hypothetical protein
MGVRYPKSDQEPYSCGSGYYKETLTNELCNGFYIEEFGTFCYKQGKYHRLDGPACDYTDRTKEWWLEGGSWFIVIIVTS